MRVCCSLFVAVSVLVGSLTNTCAQEVLDGSGDQVKSHLQGIKDAFGKRLVDPSSLQLRSLRLAKTAGTDYMVVCGEFNAKNGFGGYSGFEPFQYLPPSGVVALGGC